MTNQHLFVLVIENDCTFFPAVPCLGIVEHEYEYGGFCVWCPKYELLQDCYSTSCVVFPSDTWLSSFLGDLYS